MACGAPTLESNGSSLEEVTGNSAILVDPLSLSEIVPRIRLRGPTANGRLTRRMPKILFLTPYSIEGASERYRIYQFLPYLEQRGFVCTVRPFAPPSLFRAIQEERPGTKLFDLMLSCIKRALDVNRAAEYDIVYILREAFPFFCPFFERAILKRNANVVFDFDDALHIGHQNFEGHRYSPVYKFKYGTGVNEVLKACAFVIAGSPTLAEHARQFNPRVAVIPTVVDLERYSTHPQQHEDRPLTIGWMGSRSTSPYLLQIEQALQRLSRVHDGEIRFRLFGDPRRTLDLPNFESRPFHLESEIDDLRSLDVGLMPIVDNAWTRGKCAFKAIQYMALAIPVVASPVGMATDVVENNVNGFLARTPQEWFEALSRLVSSAELRRRMGVEARRTVEERYSLQRWGPILADFLLDIVEGRAPRIEEQSVTAQIEGSAGSANLD